MAFCRLLFILLSLMAFTPTSDESLRLMRSAPPCLAPSPRWRIPPCPSETFPHLHPHPQPPWRPWDSDADATLEAGARGWGVHRLRATYSRSGEHFGRDFCQTSRHSSPSPAIQTRTSYILTYLTLRPLNVLAVMWRKSGCSNVRASRRQSQRDPACQPPAQGPIRGPPPARGLA